MIKKQTHLFPPLESRCKNAFPFALACPSFVYPAGYGENVRQLAPFVDEIELLFFESRFPDSLPSPALVGELAQLARSGQINYNIHLPTDIFLGHPDAGIRLAAVNVLKQMIDRCAPLNPTTFTLHLIREPFGLDSQRWQVNITAALEDVLAGGLSSRLISVETLDYDFELAAPIIAHLDLSVCMDMGHLMAHGIDITEFYDTWKKRITIAHLHGVEGERDHLPLDRLSTALMAKVMDVLKRFSGSVSLEVFSFKALNASMAHLLGQRF